MFAEPRPSIEYCQIYYLPIVPKLEILIWAIGSISETKQTRSNNNHRKFSVVVTKLIPSYYATKIFQLSCPVLTWKGRTFYDLTVIRYSAEIIIISVSDKPKRNRNFIPAYRRALNIIFLRSFYHIVFKLITSDANI